MNIVIFNVCLLLAWALVSTGAVLVFGLGIGLIACGACLVVLCCVAVTFAGGIYTSDEPVVGSD